ncbi:hypothetical protein [Actinoplanes sp. NPDC020271]|uniref:hypothetical protein n=1 Tax=Actinoplanes sp. NPDC020271 TaxID=3363896 RepID=UPI0037A644F1
MAAPRVELLWWSGCPSHGKARTMPQAALTEAGLDPTGMETLQVVTEEEAAQEGFVGSPAIRINGTDIVAPDDQPPALTCRLYVRRDGRPGPLPDPADLRDALAAALTRS